MSYICLLYTSYGEQRVYYINLQEIKGLKFGTRTPVNYFDSFYNAELFLRAHGTYSVKITDPLKFYGEVIPKNTDHVEMDEINEQYLNEYMAVSYTHLDVYKRQRQSFQPAGPGPSIPGILSWNPGENGRFPEGSKEI